MLLTKMTRHAPFVMLLAILAFALLASATPTPHSLTPRFVAPSNAPDVCFDGHHHCLTVQTIDGGFIGLYPNGCNFSQAIDHTGYSWRSFVFDGPCGGVVELSCQANATTGLAGRGAVQFGFSTEPPVGGVSASFLTTESPLVLGKAFGGSELMDATFRLGKKRLEDSRRTSMHWVTWCKLWGR